MKEMKNVDLAAIKDRFLNGQHDEADMKRLKLYETLSRYMNRPGCNLQIPIPGRALEIVLGADTYGGIHFRLQITDGQALDLLRQARQSTKENYNKLDGYIAAFIPMPSLIKEE